MSPNSHVLLIYTCSNHYYIPGSGSTSVSMGGTSISTGSSSESSGTVTDILAMLAKQMQTHNLPFDIWWAFDWVILCVLCLSILCVQVIKCIILNETYSDFAAWFTLSLWHYSFFLSLLVVWCSVGLITSLGHWRQLTGVPCLRRSCSISWTLWCVSCWPSVSAVCA